VKVQDIVNRLTVLGLDEPEAAVYVQLSIMGPSKASDIAAALRLHRTEAYRTLQDLVQRGFATATLARPSRFEAVPPERLFSSILSSLEARSQTVQRAAEEIAPALTTLRSQTTEGTSRNTFKVLQGRREIHSVAERMVREAKQGIKLVNTHEAAVAMIDMTGLLDTLQEQAGKGVAVRAALRTSAQARKRLASLAEVPNLALLHLETGTLLRYILVDEREMLVWVVNDPSPRLTSDDEVALWTDAADYVRTEAFHFDLVWREGKDLRTLAVAEGLLAEGTRTGVGR
jgi:sugar-specific transcriptional regulator TrmB